MDEEEYDQAGCLKWLNKYFEYHNELLQIEINRLQGLYPHTNIIYADYFNAALRFYHSPEQFGSSTLLSINFFCHTKFSGLQVNRKVQSYSCAV